MSLEIKPFLADIFESPVKVGLIGASIVFTGYVLSQQFKDSSNIPTPPGPPRNSFIRNLLRFPQNNFYENFIEWQKTYGDVVSADLVGTPIVILNSYNVAHELLDKRPNTTSGRRTSYYMVREVMGWNWPLPRLQPGPSHTTQRRMLRRAIGPQRVGSYDTLIEGSSNQLIIGLQSVKGNPHQTVQRAIGEFVINVAYGKRVHSSLPELSSWHIEHGSLMNLTTTNIWMVDALHFLRFVPSWFPGAGFQKIAARFRHLSNQIRSVSYVKARELYESGTIDHSLATDLLDEFGPNDDARDVLGILYSTAARTTSAAVVAFLHDLYLFPEIAQKIHDEIIAITDGIRMPQISDRPKMSYTEAVWMESFRWKPLLAMGVPHVNTQDEIINGYLVKAGTEIFPNNWSMMMDERLWGDPDNFRPERFLGPEASSLPNPLTITFGYGTRSCPGMYLADRAGFQLVAATAALYEVSPLEGKSRPDPKLVKHTNGMFRLPVGFECQFLPRDQQAEELLKAIRLAE